MPVGTLEDIQFLGELAIVMPFRFIEHNHFFFLKLKKNIPRFFHKSFASKLARQCIQPVECFLLGRIRLIGRIHRLSIRVQPAFNDIKDTSLRSFRNRQMPIICKGLSLLG